MLYELRVRRGLIELVCDERVVLAMTPEQARRNAAKLGRLADEADSIDAGGLDVAAHAPEPPGERSAGAEKRTTELISCGARPHGA